MVSVRGVARELGQSPMGLYRYFPGGRDEILAKLRGYGFISLASHLRLTTKDSDHLIAQLVGLVIGGIDYACRHPETYRLMFEVTQETDRHGDLASIRKVAWNIVSRVFVDAAKSGVVRGDPNSNAHLFMAAAHGVILLEFSQQPYAERNLKHLIVPMLEMLLRGVGVAELHIEKVPEFVELAQARLKSLEGAK